MENVNHETNISPAIFAAPAARIRSKNGEKK